MNSICPRSERHNTSINTMQAPMDQQQPQGVTARHQAQSAAQERKSGQQQICRNRSEPAWTSCRHGPRRGSSGASQHQTSHKQQQPPRHQQHSNANPTRQTLSLCCRVQKAVTCRKHQITTNNNSSSSNSSSNSRNGSTEGMRARQRARALAGTAVTAARPLLRAWSCTTVPCPPDRTSAQ